MLAQPVKHFLFVCFTKQIGMNLLLKNLSSSPLSAFSFSPNSKQFLRVLALGCNISAADYPRFVQDLAEERQGMSLVYTHHQDSLRSGSSYQSPSHVSLRNNLQVCVYLCVYVCVCACFGGVHGMSLMVRPHIHRSIGYSWSHFP